MYRQGDITLSANFNLAAGIPLRAGDVVTSVEELELIPAIERFVGRPTWVVEEKTFYIQNADLTTWSFMESQVNPVLTNKILYGGLVFQDNQSPREIYVDSPDNRGSGWTIGPQENSAPRTYFVLPEQDDTLYRKSLLLLGENNAITLLNGDLAAIPIPPAYDIDATILIAEILISPESIQVGGVIKYHDQNTDDFVGFGTPFQSSKEEIRAKLDEEIYTDEKAVEAVYAKLQDTTDIQFTRGESGEIRAYLVNPISNSPTIFYSVVDPDETFDTYEVGDRLINTVGKRIWECVDATSGAAVWKNGGVDAGRYLKGVGGHFNTIAEAITHYTTYPSLKEAGMIISIKGTTEKHLSYTPLAISGINIESGSAITVASTQVFLTVYANKFHFNALNPFLNDIVQVQTNTNYNSAGTLLGIDVLSAYVFLYYTTKTIRIYYDGQPYEDEEYPVLAIASLGRGNTDNGFRGFVKENRPVSNVTSLDFRVFDLANEGLSERLAVVSSAGYDNLSNGVYHYANNRFYWINSSGNVWRVISYDFDANTFATQSTGVSVTQTTNSMVAVTLGDYVYFVKGVSNDNHLLIQIDVNTGTLVNSAQATGVNATEDVIHRWYDEVDDVYYIVVPVSRYYTSYHSSVVLHQEDALNTTIEYTVFPGIAGGNIYGTQVIDNCLYFIFETVYGTDLCFAKLNLKTGTTTILETLTRPYNFAPVNFLKLGNYYYLVESTTELPSSIYRPFNPTTDTFYEIPLHKKLNYDLQTWTDLSDSIDLSSIVSSINNKKGDVTLTTGDLSEVTNKRYLTDAQQTSLNSLSSSLAGKENAITGTTTADFWSGAKTFRNLATDVRAVILTGLDLASAVAVAATDTFLVAIGKLQKQITDNLATLTSHTANTSNPHSVTKSQVGLGNVDNTSDTAKPVSTAQQTALNLKADASSAVTLTGVQTLTNKTLTAPAISSPTGLVKSDVGLSNVDNTSDVNKPISTATQTALNLKADASTVVTNTSNIATNTAAIGTLSSLTTTDKTSLVSAINENKTGIDTLAQDTITLKIYKYSNFR